MPVICFFNQELLAKGSQVMHEEKAQTASQRSNPWNKQPILEKSLPERKNHTAWKGVNHLTNSLTNRRNYATWIKRETTFSNLAKTQKQMPATKKRVNAIPAHFIELSI
jgi:hypothetical protein